MQIFHADKTAHFKIVYHGAGLGGKTTNMHQIFSRLKPEQRLSQNVIEVPTQQDKTLTFDFMPLTIGKIGMYEVVLKFYTVPGQVHYENSRKLILDDVDGVVFVADSQPELRNENIRMLNELQESLKAQNSDNEVVTILQLNKRDLPDVMDVEQMLSGLQKNDEAYYEASAINGNGVMETMQTIVQMVISNFRSSK